MIRSLSQRLLLHLVLTLIFKPLVDIKHQGDHQLFFLRPWLFVLRLFLHYFIFNSNNHLNFKFESYSCRLYFGDPKFSTLGIRPVTKIGFTCFKFSPLFWLFNVGLDLTHVEPTRAARPGLEFYLSTMCLFYFYLRYCFL